MLGHANGPHSFLTAVKKKTYKENMESLWLLKIFSSCNLLFIWFMIVFFFKGVIIHVLAFSVLPLSFVIKNAGYCFWPCC